MPNNFDEAMIRLAERAGFDIEHITHSLCHCQGDYFGFGGSVRLDDAVRRLVHEDSAQAAWLRARVNEGLRLTWTAPTHRSEHYQSIRIEWATEEDLDELQDAEQRFDGLCESMNDAVHALGHELMQLGYACYDAMPPADEPAEIWKEACGEGFLVLRVVADFDLDALDEDPDHTIATLEMLRAARYDAYVIGRLELVYRGPCGEIEHLPDDWCGYSGVFATADPAPLLVDFDLQQARATWGATLQQAA